MSVILQIHELHREFIAFHNCKNKKPHPHCGNEAFHFSVTFRLDSHYSNSRTRFARRPLGVWSVSYSTRSPS